MKHIGDLPKSLAGRPGLDYDEIGRTASETPGEWYEVWTKEEGGRGSAGSIAVYARRRLGGEYNIVTRGNTVYVCRKPVSGEQSSPKQGGKKLDCVKAARK